MTETATEPQTTAQRVYVRRSGYAALLAIHQDHSVTVRLEDDGSEKRIPFGDWSEDRGAPGAETSTVQVKARIHTALQLDFGDSFAEVSSGITPRDGSSWFTARYGDFAVTVSVSPES